MAVRGGGGGLPNKALEPSALVRSSAPRLSASV